MKIYVDSKITEAERERVRKLTAGDEIWFSETEPPTETDFRKFQEATIVLGNCPVDWVPQAPHLRWLQLRTVGFGQYLRLDWNALEQRITWTHLKGFFAEPVAETALGGILAFYRALREVTLLQTTKDWQEWNLRPRMRLLEGAHVVLLGCGAIAMKLCDLLAPFHCRLTLFGKTSPRATVRSLDDLDRALAEADVVCSILPETPETVGLLDASRLARIRPGALFVNVGRGSVVDEKALAAALHSGALGGAVLDVTIEEPLPSSHPFWSCPNILLTQHTGAFSGIPSRESEQMMALFARNLAHFRKNEPLEAVVDWKRGY